MKLDCVRCHKCGKVHSVEKGCNIDWDNPCKEIDKDKVIMKTIPIKINKQNFIQEYCIKNNILQGK